VRELAIAAHGPAYAGGIDPGLICSAQVHRVYPVSSANHIGSSSTIRLLRKRRFMCVKTANQGSGANKIIGLGCTGIMAWE
jgi:hypothetical protein